MNFKSDVSYRKQQLRKLQEVIVSREHEIIAALDRDFKKPAFESVLTETALTLSELRHTIKNISRWSQPSRVWPSLLNFPSSDKIYKEPYGKVLVIAPWNYPFQLALLPVIAAVAAGNCVVVKPSELSPNVAAEIDTIIKLVFNPEHVRCVQGGPDATQNLLAQKWDYIFFTGSPAVGRIVAEAAARNLTPATLELGGKNPCIIDASANLELAARRICWGKFLNAGQTCIAPDYVLVQNKVKAKFIDLMRTEIQKAYGENPQNSPDFARIINDRHWSRLADMISPAACAVGGQTQAGTRYIAPTLLDEPALDSNCMQDEIFGPVLPVISYENESEIDTILARYDKPLALYVFSTRKVFVDGILGRHSFGGACVNDTVVQFGNGRLPFGGVGQSGYGAYHGKHSFDTFTHQKPVVRRANWLDIPIRYAPYGNKINLVKKLFNWL